MLLIMITTFSYMQSYRNTMARAFVLFDGLLHSIRVYFSLDLPCLPGLIEAKASGIDIIERQVCKRLLFQIHTRSGGYVT